MNLAILFDGSDYRRIFYGKIMFIRHFDLVTRFNGARAVEGSLDVTSVTVAGRAGAADLFAGSGNTRRYEGTNLGWTKIRRGSTGV